MAKPLLTGSMRKAVLIIAWFGPNGVAALSYCFYSYKKLHPGEIWTVTSLIVFSSVVVHGMTASPFLKQYAGKKEGNG